MQTPTPTPTPVTRRRRWPIFAAVLSALLVLGVLTATLISGGGRPALATNPDEVALELALEDIGGVGELVDTPADPGAAPAAEPQGRRHRGPLGARLADSSLLVGTVASVGGGKLTVTRDGGGGDLAVTTTDKTRVRGGDNKAVGDIQAGERVVVRVGADKQAVGVLVLRPHVAGTVTALNGDKATVTRPSGLTQVVDLSALSDKPKVGDLIAVVGSSADNGATLKAEKIRQLPKAS